VYLSIVSVAIVVSFHLKSQPGRLEQRISLPVGLIFWVLSLACLGCGCAIYVKTVTKYSKRQALVQSGWKTQTASVVGLLACQGTNVLTQYFHTNINLVALYHRSHFNHRCLRTVFVHQ
jgi:pyruvate/2-oxoacid:ferredoxin oxidoreductase beta subunit